MKRRCGSLFAAAVSHSREDGPVSIARRSQRGAVAHEYFPRLSIAAGLGMVWVENQARV